MGCISYIISTREGGGDDIQGQWVTIHDGAEYTARQSRLRGDGDTQQRSREEGPPLLSFSVLVNIAAYEEGSHIQGHGPWA